MTSKPTKKQQRLTATQSRAARRSRKQSRGKLLRYGGALLIVAIALLLILSLILPGLPIGTGSTGDSQTGVNLNPFDSPPEGNWIKIENQGAEHVFPDSEHPDYNSTPATSGWHYGATAKWGEHRDEVPDEVLLHNLEHAGIGIHYNCIENCQDLITGLLGISKDYHKIVLSPYSNMDNLITLTAWGYIDKMDSLEKERIVAFIDRHINSSEAPEPWAP